MTTCAFCHQPLLADGRCSLCPPQREYHSPTEVVERYLVLLARSDLPALDPSQEQTRGGIVGPVPSALHERARLRRLLEAALGSPQGRNREWWRALEVVYSPFGRAKSGHRGLHENCKEALLAIRHQMLEAGWLERSEEEEMSREPLMRGWDAIADFLEVNRETVRRWYNGPAEKDPCGIQKAVTRIESRLVVARQSDLEICWERLYPSRMSAPNCG